MEQKKDRKARVVPNWVKARCPICNREYNYPEGQYRPSTCGNFRCLQKWLHPEISKPQTILYIRRQGEN